MKSLTAKQLAVLECIYQSIQDQGYPPTVREIGAVVGLSSTSTVHSHLIRLESKGYIQRDSSKTRAIEITPLALEALDVSPDKIPLLGQVAAGSPILAIEEAVDFYPVPPNIKYDSSELFMLEINGDSMVNIGILHGDLITVRKQSSANNGDIVIALTDENEATCKTYYRKDNYHLLHPENDYMDDIIMDSVQILGKVVALSRNY